MRVTDRLSIYIVCLLGLILGITQSAWAIHWTHGGSKGGDGAGEPAYAGDESSSEAADTVVIPGPLRPFLRMAGISQQIRPEELVPTLARNVALYGYHGD